MLKQQIIAAIATPPGEGGIAIIRASGEGASGLAAKVFRPISGKDVRQFSGYSVHFGQIVENETGETIDEGLLTLFRAPHSYTGEDAFELSCHGGRATTSLVLQTILEAGARLAEPGEFTQRAFMNGRIDLAQAEAVADVIRASADSAQRIARRQLEGDLSKAVRGLRDELIGVLAAIEVTIDFSEEVGELEHEPILQRLTGVLVEVERLLSTAEQGRILREGVRVALIGRPNVGKSSLFNALLGSERSIVTHLPGTTRDLLEETANIEGVPLLLVDLAGIRETDNLVERIGVERAEQAARECDLLLLLIDGSEGVTKEDREVLVLVQSIEGSPTLVVVNKSDVAMPEKPDLTILELKRLLPDSRCLSVSALTGAGIPELKRLILEVVGGAGFNAEAASRSVTVSNARHREALLVAQSCLLEATKTTELKLPGDFIAIDARGALDALGLITGETVTDDIVHRIFRDFCVGK